MPFEPIDDYLDATLAFLLFQDWVKWAERRGREIRYITDDGELYAIRFDRLAPQFPPPRFTHKPRT